MIILDELNYEALDLNLLLANIEDYRTSDYGTLFLLRIKEEFLDHFINNKMYVEIVSHKVDRSDYSPVVITPDRQFFIRGSDDGKIKVFGLFDGDLVRVFGDHKGEAVITLAMSRDGNYIASSSDSIIKLWHYETGTLIHSFKGHNDTVEALVFDPNGQVLVSGSDDDEMSESGIKVWDVREEKLKATKGSHWRSITSLSFSSNGDYLVSGALDKTVNVWNMANGRLINTLVGHKKGVVEVAITDEMRVISTSHDDTIKVWNGRTGKVLRELDFTKLKIKNAQFSVVNSVLSPNQEFIVAGLQGKPLKGGSKLIMWNFSNGEIIQTLPVSQWFPGYYEELNQLTISDDGIFILSASLDRMINVWMEFIEYMDFQEIIQKMYNQPKI